MERRRPISATCDIRYLYANVCIPFDHEKDNDNQFKDIGRCEGMDSKELKTYFDVCRENDFVYCNLIRMFVIKGKTARKVLMKYARLVLEICDIVMIKIVYPMLYEVTQARWNLAKYVLGVDEVVGKEVLNDYERLIAEVKVFEENVGEVGKFGTDLMNKLNQDNFYSKVDDAVQKVQGEYSVIFSQFIKVLGLHGKTNFGEEIQKLIKEPRKNLFFNQFKLAFLMNIFEREIKYDFKMIHQRYCSILSMVRMLSQRDYENIIKLKMDFLNHPLLDPANLIDYEISSLKLKSKLSEDYLFDPLSYMSNEKVNYIEKIAKFSRSMPTKKSSEANHADGDKLDEEIMGEKSKEEKKKKKSTLEINSLSDLEDEVSILELFFRNLVFKFTRNSLLMKWQVECSTEPNKRRARLLFDVRFF